MLFFSVPSWAEVTCGQQIGPNEKVKLKQDLTCTTIPALTLVGPNATLNLGGHTVACQGTESGIEIEGTNATLKKGTVTDCLAGVVLVASGGGHRVTKVTATNNGFVGFFIGERSHGNRLDYNTARNNGDPDSVTGDGFSVSSMDNAIQYNMARGNGRIGFVVGNMVGGNRIAHNVAKENAIGITIAQIGGIVKKNVAFKNRAVGFEIAGPNISIEGNLAKDNGNGDFPEISQGFQIAGENLNLMGNTAIGNLDEGYLVVGLGHTLKLNTAVKNGTAGIRSGATDSTFRGNLALGNKGTDLVDEILGCDNNDWKFNFFKTRNQNCIR